MGIGRHAFQVAGGVVLFLFAPTMIFNQNPTAISTRRSKGACAPRWTGRSGCFRGRWPSLATPGAMRVIVLLTDIRRTILPGPAGSQPFGTRIRAARRTVPGTSHVRPTAKTPPGFPWRRFPEFPAVD
ncbi:hypothetical protein [Tropicimonas sp. IMCC34043]|uniref:hypothetical protein n=1 Tax=Tropicimonas sp. IMCC34043 TaxID=2248760 RepID=UPI001E2CC652